MNQQKTPQELADLTKENKAFSINYPGLQLVWDSTSLGLLKECPRKYYYTMLEGWAGAKGVPIDEATGWPGETGSMHLDFGIFYHKAIEIYDLEKAKGKDHDQALHHCVTWLMNNTGIHNEAGAWLPWTTGDQYKNRYTLVRSVVWYLEAFKEDVAETIILDNGKAAVELSFKLDTQLASEVGDNYMLAGHLDRLAKIGDDVMFMDKKTTKSTLSSHYFDKFNPDNQMTLYTLASRIVFGVPAIGGIIDAAQIAVGFTRFARGIINRTQAQMNEWLTDFQYLMAENETYARTGYWPMNDKACDMYGGCPFRGICSKDPAVRHNFLESNFARRVWDPTVPRNV